MSDPLRGSHFTPQGRATLVEAEQALQARLDRATELYLGGAISKEKYQAEKWQHQVDKAGLHPAALDAIMAAGHTLEGFAQRWAAAQTPLEKNELLRLVLAGARIKEHSLTALVVKLAFYPLMRHWRSGDDGSCGLWANIQLLPEDNESVAKPDRKLIESGR